MSAAGPTGPPVAVHQFVPTLNPRDATGSHTLALRDLLRAAGWHSNVYAEAIHDDLAAEATKYWHYPDQAQPGDVVLYQFSTSSAVAGFLAGRSERLILNFHNFTAPEHFAGWEPHTEARATRAGEELDQLAVRAVLGVADSSFNQTVLRRAGLGRTVVVAPLADYGRIGPGSASDARVAAALAAAKATGGADLLFVGRIVPSKGQHELVKMLWAYRRLYDPAARLHLVGGASSFSYLTALRAFVRELGLVDAVRITGEIADTALAAHFQAADAYVSMSAHEGFGVPLVEAMAAGVPVVARAAGAVAETMAGAGILVAGGEPLASAAAVRRVVCDGALRAVLIEAGHRRVASLAAAVAGPGLVAAVASVAGAPR